MRPELEDLPQPNWFWHGEQILALVEEYKPMTCVEIGTNRGCSAIATARLVRRWGGHVRCIDTWEMEQYGASVSLAECQQNVEKAGVADVVLLEQKRSSVAAQHYEGSSIDYLYIDADHTYDACTADLESWWPYLKVGGLIAGDDYEDPYDPIACNVTRAWDDFEERHKQTFVRTATPGLQSRLIWGIKQ